LFGIAFLNRSISAGDIETFAYIMMILGIVIFIAVLTVIIVCVKLSRGDANTKRRIADKVSDTADAEEPYGRTPDGYEGEIAAAIVASISMMRKDGDFRVKSIAPADTSRETWAAAGLKEQFKSRKAGSCRR